MIDLLSSKLVHHCKAHIVLRPGLFTVCMMLIAQPRPAVKASQPTRLCLYDWGRLYPKGQAGWPVTAWHQVWPLLLLDATNTLEEQKLLHGTDTVLPCCRAVHQGPDQGLRARHHTRLNMHLICIQRCSIQHYRSGACFHRVCRDNKPVLLPRCTLVKEPCCAPE